MYYIHETTIGGHDFNLFMRQRVAEAFDRITRPPADSPPAPLRLKLLAAIAVRRLHEMFAQTDFLELFCPATWKRIYEAAQFHTSAFDDGVLVFLSSGGDAGERIDSGDCTFRWKPGTNRGSCPAVFLDCEADEVPALLGAVWVEIEK